ncbi:MAG: hypothetical protein MRY57_01465 [Candidatus Pacebacteria bacterium]|nr:hypothetical protein [Candidatus Paceibacterota bacterium]
MKWNYIATALAGVLLIGTGIYWFNNSSYNDYWEPTEEKEYREVIDGEEYVLDTPLTESFSNQASNEAAKNSRAATNSSSSSSGIVDAMKKPFVVGMFYLNNIADKFDACSYKGDASSDQLQDDIKNQGDLDVLTVSNQPEASYLVIQPENYSEKTCLSILQFKNITANIIKPIHIFFVK